MFEWLLRGYDKTVLGLFKSRGGVIENEGESPIPGVTKLPGAADLIEAIFVADCERQEAEYLSRAMQRFETSGPSIPNAGVGTIAGTSFISFNSKRK